jgi:hypothetical protein
MTPLGLLCGASQLPPVLAGLALLGWVTPAAAEFDLVRDPHFRRGFTVSAPAPGRHVLAGVFRPDPHGRDPVWRVTQWNSRFPLTDFTARLAPDGSCTLANAAKSVHIARPGTPEADLSLAVNGWLEYGGQARRSGEPWVHLLVDQEFSREAWLPDLSALRLHLEARVRKCDRDPSAEYLPAIHAAQVTVFISVQNRNPASSGFGDYYHFGIPVFDNREPMPAGLVAGDPGTGKLMYCPGAAAWSSASTHGGQWVTFQGDLLPALLKGLQAAWERGFLKDSRDLADYRPAGLCVGWEVPGVFDVAVQIRGLSLRAVPR